MSKHYLIMSIEADLDKKISHFVIPRELLGTSTGEKGPRP